MPRVHRRGGPSSGGVSNPCEKAKVDDTSSQCQEGRLKSNETCATLIAGTPMPGASARSTLRARMSETRTRAISPTPPGLTSSEPGRRAHPVVDQLVERSRRLGADPRNTNYAGGNTSAKGVRHRPGDRPGRRAAVGQGLRRRSGHADRGRPRRPPTRSSARARRCLSRRRWRGRDGRGVRPLPVRARRRCAVDRHRDARARRGGPRRPPAPGLGHRAGHRGRRRSADARRASAIVSRGCRGGDPASSSGSTSRRSGATGRTRSGSMLGGHGITAWGDTSDGVRGQLAGHHPDRRALHRRRMADPSRSGQVVEGTRTASRTPLAANGPRRSMPLLRGLASTDRPQVGHYTDTDVVLDFVARESMPRLAALGTSCPDHFLRTKVRPLVLDVAPAAPARGGRGPPA